VIDLGIEGVLAYRRTAEGGDGFLVVLNFGEEMHELNLHQALGGQATELVLSTELIPSRVVTEGIMAMNGNEGVILRLRQWG